MAGGGETNVGAIAVEILARTDKLEAGLKKAAGGFSAFSGVVAGATAAVTNFALNAATSAASSIAGLVKTSFESIGAAQDLAIALNSDTQALQGLQYAAKNTGANAESLNSALTKMNVNIGKGLAGNKEAAAGFDALGLRIEDLAGMGADEAFSKIATEIAKLPTPAQQAQAAVDIFGKSASDLLPLLTSGADGIEELQMRYSELSGGMSELDVSKVQLAGDLMDDLGVVVKGVADQIAVNLAPFISAAANKLIELGFNGKNAVMKVSEGFSWLEGVLKEVATWTVRIYQGWLSFQYVFQFLETAFTSYFATIEKGFNWLSGKIKDFTVGQIDLGQSTFFDNWSRMSEKAMAETGKEINALSTMLENDVPANFVGKVFEDIKLGADEAAQKIVDLAEKRKSLAREASRTLERDEKAEKLKAPKANTNNFRTIDATLINANALGVGKTIETQQLTEAKKQTKLLQDVKANTNNFKMVYA